MKDFRRLQWFPRVPLVLVVNAGLPVNSIKDLIALAKAKPGELNLSVGVRGGPPHLAAEFFNIMAGVKIADIQYKSTTATLTAVQSGEAQLTFAPVTSVSVLGQVG